MPPSRERRRASREDGGEERDNRLPALAAELVRLKVDVIVMHSAPGMLGLVVFPATRSRVDREIA